MLKKISHSEISLYLMPIYSSSINECIVCNVKIDNRKKMIVFDEKYLPIGFSCKYCNSIYNEDDILVDLGNPDKLDLYGES